MEDGMRRVIVCAAIAVLGMCVQTVAVADLMPIEQEAVRARAEVSSAVATLESTSDRVRALLRRARTRGHAAEAACLDAALSRADTATRYGRDHAQRALAAWRTGDAPTARQEMLRVAWRRDASRDASRAADACAAPEERVVRQGTTVRVWIDPSLPRDVSDYP